MNFIISTIKFNEQDCIKYIKKHLLDTGDL